MSTPVLCQWPWSPGHWHRPVLYPASTKAPIWGHLSAGTGSHCSFQCRLVSACSRIWVHSWSAWASLSAVTSRPQQWPWQASVCPAVSPSTPLLRPPLSPTVLAKVHWPSKAWRAHGTLYSVKLPFKNENKMKIFSEKQKLKVLVTDCDWSMHFRKKTLDPEWRFKKNDEQNKWGETQRSRWRNESGWPHYFNLIDNSMCRWHHPNGRKWKGTKEPLDAGERGEWKSWLKTQHSKN